MEFKRFCPGFKIITYYGSAKARKAKRQGWTKNNAFHICITSYQLAAQCPPPSPSVSHPLLQRYTPICW